MEENGTTIIVSSDEESPPCKVRKIDKKLPETTKIYYFQELKNTGIKNRKEVDNIINLDEDEPTPNKINGNCNISQENNELSKRIEIDFKKLHETEQEFKNTEIKNEMEVDNVICLDEEDSTSDIINERYNMPQANSELSKQTEIDIKKIPQPKQTYHFQEFRNIGIKNEMGVDNVISLDEDKSTSNKINEKYNMPQANSELSKQIEIDIKKLPETEQTYHFQEFKNSGLEKQKKVDNIISFDEDVPTSNKINCNMPQENNVLSKRKEINIKKLPETEQTYHFQELKNSEIEIQKEVDDITFLDENESTSKRTELTTGKDDNKGLLSYDEIDKKIEKNSNKLNVIKFQNKDDTITSNEDKSTSKEIKGLCNISQKNKSPKRKELTTVKDDNKGLSSCVEGDEKYEKNINKLNKENNEESKNQSTSKESTSENTTIILSPEFENFLEVCTSCNCGTKYKSMILEKFPKIKYKYNDADEKFVNSGKFKKLLITATERIQNKPKNAVLIFNEIYRELEVRKKQNINLNDQEERHLNKLYSILRKVHKKVIELESEEVNFDDDNNSSYIMLERYKERLCSIQKKICNYTKENFYSGRYLYRNLNFSSSKHSEINRSIDKLYNKKKQFPSFYEVNQCVRKCVTNNNINLTEDVLTKEILSVYKALGNILQRRRKTELFDTLSSFLDGTEDDPADQDPELEDLLKKRQEESEKKISEILQKYTDSQGRGEDTEEPSLSSDSDDSHHVSDDNDS